MKSIFYLLRLLPLLLLIFTACKEDDPPNPFDQVEQPTGPDTVSIELNAASIEGLHANIFGKTCANSGCHDGTFEPDFRTIESSYNTLVYQPIIKNDLQGTYQYRVLPSNATASQLIARLTVDIDGNSGIMPLVIEPDSDWNDKKAEYIQNVKDWIEAGAKDLTGNPGMLNDNGRPSMLGVAANAGAWLNRRGSGLGPLQVPRSQPRVDIYIALTDDKTNTKQLTNNKIRFAKSIDAFDDATDLPLEVLNSAIEEPGFEGAPVAYFHKISIDPLEYGDLGETIYFRVYVKDDANPITEIPANGGATYIKDYFSFTIID